MNEPTTETSNIRLPESFTLASVAELKTELDASIANSDTIKLDGSKVERVDGAAVQLLFHCSTLLVKKPSDLELLQPSEILQDALKVMGMEKLLGTASALDDENIGTETGSKTEPQAA